MPQGLQVWDENGVLTVDITNRLVKIVGRINTVSNVSGSLTVPSELGGEVWFACQPTYKRILSIARPPTATVSGRTISWTSAPQAIIIEYGIY